MSVVTRHLSRLRSRVRRTLAALGIVLIHGAILASPANASVDVTRVLVDVDFTTATINSSTITNDATDKTDDLTVVGSPTGIGTASGLTFANTTTANTNQYLTGNLGNTSVMSEIVVEFVGKFTDTGCAAQPNGSMVFGLGTAASFIPYNIYRHSNFIGFNTFSSDIYGIEIPDTSSYHSYKFVMVPRPAAQSSQEIWVDGVKQTLVQQSTSVATSPCSTIAGSENISNRVFTGGANDYTDGSFMLMTHPLLALNWGTTGSLKNVRITTTDTYDEPSAPSIDSITAGDGQLSIHFTAPTSNGGSEITDYKYSTDGGATWVSASSTSSPIVVTGLTNDTSYNVKLLAVNVAGDGSPSSSVSATPTVSAGGPSAPVVDDVVVGNGTVSLFFTPPTDDGGSTIIDYEYSVDDGGTWTSAESTSSPIVIRGLTNGTNYSVMLRAVNSDGAGTASAAVSATPSEHGGSSNDHLALTGANNVTPMVGSLAAIAVGIALLSIGRRRKRRI